MTGGAPNKLVANPFVVAQPAKDGAVLLMQMVTGDCFELNQVGAEMWERLTNGEALADVVAAIARRYAAPAAGIDSDARALIAELVRRGLVTTEP